MTATLLARCQPTVTSRDAVSATCVDSVAAARTSWASSASAVRAAPSVFASVTSEAALSASALAERTGARKRRTSGHRYVRHTSRFSDVSCRCVPLFCLCWRLANAVGSLVNYHLLQERIENQRFDVQLDDVTSTTLQPDSQRVLVAHDAGQITVSPRHVDRPLYWSVPAERLGDWVMGRPVAIGDAYASSAASFTNNDFDNCVTFVDVILMIISVLCRFRRCRITVLYGTAWRMAMTRSTRLTVATLSSSCWATTCSGWCTRRRPTVIAPGVTCDCMRYVLVPVPTDL